MSHTRLWIVAAIIASAIGIGFLLSVPHTGDVAGSEDRMKAASPVAPPVALRDSFKKGVHTITGFVEAPDACAAALAQASLEGDAPETRRIVVAISFEESEGVCLELPTRADFSATLAAPAGVPLAATVNGIAATTTAP
jgi:hypothetical protein